MKYDDSIQTHEAIPEAASMIETFRAIGYSLETAIADIIDNSITAGADTITIQRVWNGGNSYIAITDNGKGMTNDELKFAMRPGARNPLEERDENDLGRFGLGLKTASFSQCRKLTVISKKEGYVSYWTWDLDYVAETKSWKLIRWMPKECNGLIDALESGTIVIWSSLDHIVPPNTSKENASMHEKFSNLLDKAMRHLSMTFHRFIDEKSVSIIWGSHPIEPWNPFCPSETKGIPFSSDELPGGVMVKGYVLPHKAAFSTETAYHRAAGPSGWNTQQGFYVYRGKRLLLAGDWLGMFKKDEQNKLARIAIDLPNSQDIEWQIDIKKSKANPPANCREQLEQYAKKVRSTAENVFRHRGKILKQRAGQEFHPLWLEKNKDGNWSYVINRTHPIISHFKEHACDFSDKSLETLLKIIETTVPTKTIYINEAKDEKRSENVIVDAAEIKTPITILYNSFLSKGKSPKQAKALLKTIEPFNLYEDLIEQL